MIEDLGLDLEASLLFVLLSEPALMMSANISPEHFQSDVHGEIFRVMQQTYADIGTIDMVAMSEKMQPHLQATVIDIFQNDFGSSANLESYCDRLKELYGERQGKKVGVQLAENGDIGSAITALLNLDSESEERSHSMRSALKGLIDKLSNPESMIGIPSGFPTIDRVVGGWHQKDLIVVGSRPAVGKTAFMINAARASGVPTLIISAEMGADQIIQRMISAQASVPSQLFRTGGLTDDHMRRIVAAAAETKDDPIYMFDEPSPTFSTVLREVQRHIHKYGVKLVMIDYLQRLTPSDARVSRSEQVARDVRAIKTMSQRLDIATLLLCQVNRAVDERDDKVPRMSDMSDSSEIEKEADVILTLYREGAYNSNIQGQDNGVISMCKNRHGPKGDVSIHYIGDELRFVENQTH